MVSLLICARPSFYHFLRSGTLPFFSDLLPDRKGNLKPLPFAGTFPFLASRRLFVAWNSSSKSRKDRYSDSLSRADQSLDHNLSAENKDPSSKKDDGFGLLSPETPQLPNLLQQIGRTRKAPRSERLQNEPNLLEKSEAKERKKKPLKELGSGEMDHESTSEEEEERQLWKRDVESMDPIKRRKFKYIGRDVSLCRGCGVKLHSEEPDKLGFVPTPPSSSKKKRRICLRCFRMKYHSKDVHDNNKHNLICKTETPKGFTLEDEFADFSIVEKQPQILQTLEKTFKTKRAIIVLVVDLTDMHKTSFIKQIETVTGANPLFVVGTKVDLLPKEASDTRVRSFLAEQIRKECHFPALPTSQVFLVSSFTGFGIKRMLSAIDNRRVDRDVYLIGSVNSGKSSLLNAIAKVIGIGGIRYHEKYRLTVSHVPATTNDLIRVPVKTGGAWFDSPGFTTETCVFGLRHEERKMISLKSDHQPFLIRICQGKSICFGGLARLDYISGPPLILSIFAQPSIIHPTSIEKAEILFGTVIGTSILSPPLLDSAAAAAAASLTGCVSIVRRLLESKSEKKERRGGKTKPWQRKGPKDKAQLQFPEENDGGKISAEKTEKEEVEVEADEDDDDDDNHLFQLQGKEIDHSKLWEKINESRIIPIPKMIKGTIEVPLKTIEKLKSREEVFAEIVFPNIGFVGLSTPLGSSVSLLFETLSASGPDSPPFLRSPLLPFATVSTRTIPKRILHFGKVKPSDYEKAKNG